MKRELLNKSRRIKINNLERNIEIKRLFCRCMMDTGSFDAFVDRLVEGEGRMIEEEREIQVEEIEREVKKEIFEKLKDGIENLTLEIKE